MDLRKLKTLIDLVSESNISELEITEAEGKVRIVKGGTAAPVQYVQTVAAPVPAVGAAAPAGAIAPAPAPTAAPVTAAPAGHVVKSPMVGTFYRAASPGAKVFDMPDFPGVATKSFDVPAMKAGTYKFECSIHPALMNGQLTVGG